MTIQEAIHKINQKKNLTTSEMEFVFSTIFSDCCDENLVRTFLISLFAKGESKDEILGAVQFLRKNGKRVECHSPDLMDCCGTGGDQKNTFNISTAVSFVLAGAGCHVAKHGNRAISSQCGSADVLQAIGVNIEANAETMARCVDEIGIGFFFAPDYYPFLKKVGSIRRTIPHRTIFNLLGPLLNPAQAKRQLIGVYDSHFVPLVSAVLKELGSESAIVVSSDDGMDEFSLTANAHVSELKEGKIRNFSFDPRESGYSHCKPSDLLGGTAQQNAHRMRESLKGHSQPLDHVVHINAAWGLMAAGKANHFMEALLMAQDSISSGRAYEKLEALVEATQE